MNDAPAGAGDDRRTIDPAHAGPAPAGSEPPILVSACLLGVACNHRGGSSPSPAVVALGEHRRLIPVCPEVAGGLTTPRAAAERQPDGRVTTRGGDDVTDAYRRGADHAVQVALAAGAREAILKARSPSCGCHDVYDGSFTGVTTPGEGVTTEALRRVGVVVCSEEDIHPTGTLDAFPGA